QFGVAEPSIVKKGDNIVIELPGLKESDFERIKNIIGRTAQLEFKIVDDSDAANDYMKSIASLATKQSGVELATPATWGEKDSNPEHVLVYYQAKTRQDLEKFARSLPKDKQLPSADEFGYEESNPRESAADDDSKKPSAEKSWHMYLMSRRAQLTGEYLTD